MKIRWIILLFLPLILGAQEVELRVQTGHTGFPKGMTLSQDGRWMASAGTDKLIKIWDVPTGRELRSFFHETLLYPTVVSIGVQRKYMVSASLYEVKLWDLEKNIELDNFSCPLVINQSTASFSYKAVALSPTVNVLAVGNYEETGTIGLLEVPSGKLIKKLKGHIDYLLSLDFSPDGKKIVSGGLDKIVRVWDVERGKEIHKLNKHMDPVFSVDYGNNDLIATSSMYNNITLWDGVSGLEKRSFKGPDKSLSANHVQISLDGKFLISCDDTNYHLWDISNGKLQRSISTFMKEFPGFGQQNYAMFSNDSKYFYTNLPLIGTYNLKGTKIRDFKGLEVYNEELGFDEKGIYPVEAKLAKDYGLIRYWNINKISTKKIPVNAGEKIYFSPGVKFIAVASIASAAGGKGDLVSAKNTKVQIYDGLTGMKITEVRGHTNGVTSVVFSSDNSWMATTSTDNTIRIWNAADFKERLKIEGLPVTYSYGLAKLLVSPDNSRLYAIGSQGPLQAYEVASGKLVNQIDLKGVVASLFAISDNNRYLAVAHTKTDMSRGNVKGQKIGTIKGKSLGMFQAITVYDVGNGKELKTVNTSATLLQTIKFKPGSTRLVIADFNGGLIEYDLPEGTLVNEYKGHSSYIRSIAFNKQGTLLASGSFDGTVRLWNTETGEELIRYITTDSLNFAAVTKENNYYCSKDAVQKIHFVSGEKVFLFEQYDVNFNRPDLVLTKVHGAQELIEAYHNAYKKRIAKMGLSEDNISLALANPDLILSKLPEEISTQNTKITYSLAATDPKNKLLAIHVLINDVPVFGTAGISVSEPDQSSIQKDIEVELTSGQNLITTYIVNDKGIESERQSFEVFLENESVKPDLYLITIGASEYKEAKWNLTYASKDADDVRTVLKTKNDLFTNVYDFFLSNQNVTVQKINSLHAELKKTKPNDVVVLFYAGHGLLDKDLNYYLATYDINFKNPPENGLPYDALSSLLDNIAARKKVVLIDACHSGEVDKESAIEWTKTEEVKGDLVFRAVGDKTIHGKTGLENSFELMKYLFTDLRKSSGATIISAAGGFEVASESKELKNGLFTLCLLEGLKNRKADVDKDGKIMLSELKDYMYKAVPALTKGMQQPTFRSENIRGDFRIW